MSEQYPERPILIVDDEPYILSSLSRVLKADGLGNIVTCSDSREVLALTKELFPVMILLDLTMPYVSGEQLLEELKTRWPEIPVLIISGVNELSLAVRCMQLGAADYLVKAIENNRLIINYDLCIRCFCRQELCPYAALSTRQGLLLRLASLLRQKRLKS